jgi:hypothetical protein
MEGGVGSFVNPYLNESESQTYFANEVTGETCTLEELSIPNKWRND